MRQPLFDAHFHIIDTRFPLVPNRGYVPPVFTVSDYRDRMRDLDVVGGAVVSGSFQEFDQTYLMDALAQLGEGFVGVTQLPASVAGSDLDALHSAGVRAVRFNLFRGGSAGLSDLEQLARHVFGRCGWHVEVYLDGKHLPELLPRLSKLPLVVVDHLGLFQDGLPALRAMLDQGHYAKASGFGRVDFPIDRALRGPLAGHADRLLFGSDLPGTRAPRGFRPDDVRRIIDAMAPRDAEAVLCRNAQRLYRL